MDLGEAAAPNCGQLCPQGGWAQPKSCGEAFRNLAEAHRRGLRSKQDTKVCHAVGGVKGLLGVIVKHTLPRSDFPARCEYCGLLHTMVIYNTESLPQAVHEV